MDVAVAGGRRSHPARGAAIDSSAYDPFTKRVYTGDALNTLRTTRLSDVIRRNTTIETEIPDNVFVVQTP